jgi:hypothetical protein
MFGARTESIQGAHEIAELLQTNSVSDWRHQLDDIRVFMDQFCASDEATEDAGATYKRPASSRMSGQAFVRDKYAAIIADAGLGPMEFNTNVKYGEVRYQP